MRREQNWPQQLEKLGKIETHNMAWRGYSPAHNLFLWEEAIALKPRLIIETFYAGNDLYDSYHLLRNQGIYFIDALPVLREYIRNGNQPYRVSWDGRSIDTCDHS